MPLHYHYYVSRASPTSGLRMTDVMHDTSLIVVKSCEEHGRLT